MLCQSDSGACRNIFIDPRSGFVSGVYAGEDLCILDGIGGAVSEHEQEKQDAANLGLKDGKEISIPRRGEERMRKTLFLMEPGRKRGKK